MYISNPNIPPPGSVGIAQLATLNGDVNVGGSFRLLSGLGAFLSLIGGGTGWRVTSDSDGSQPLTITGRSATQAAPLMGVYVNSGGTERFGVDVDGTQLGSKDLQTNYTAITPILQLKTEVINSPSALAVGNNVLNVPSTAKAALVWIHCDAASANVAATQRFALVSVRDSSNTRVIYYGCQAFAYENTAIGAGTSLNRADIIVMVPCAGGHYYLDLTRDAGNQSGASQVLVGLIN